MYHQFPPPPPPGTRIHSYYFPTLKPIICLAFSSIFLASLHYLQAGWAAQPPPSSSASPATTPHVQPILTEVHGDSFSDAHVYGEFVRTCSRRVVRSPYTQGEQERRDHGEPWPSDEDGELAALPWIHDIIVDPHFRFVKVTGGIPNDCRVAGDSDGAPDGWPLDQQVSAYEHIHGRRIVFHFAPGAARTMQGDIPEPQPDQVISVAGTVAAKPGDHGEEWWASAPIPSSLIPAPTKDSRFEYLRVSISVSVTKGDLDEARRPFFPADVWGTREQQAAAVAAGRRDAAELSTGHQTAWQAGCVLIPDVHYTDGVALPTHEGFILDDQAVELSLCLVNHEVTASRTVEYLEFHLLQGFQHVYIFDVTDPSPSHTMAEIVRPYVEAGLVTLVHFPFPIAPGCDLGGGGPQFAVGASCVARFGGSRWMGYSDVDEMFMTMGDGPFCGNPDELPEGPQRDGCVASISQSKGYDRVLDLVREVETPGWSRRRGLYSWCGSGTEIMQMEPNRPITDQPEAGVQALELQENCREFDDKYGGDAVVSISFASTHMGVCPNAPDYRAFIDKSKEGILLHTQVSQCWSPEWQNSKWQNGKMIFRPARVGTVWCHYVTNTPSNTTRLMLDPASEGVSLHYRRSVQQSRTKDDQFSGRVRELIAREPLQSLPSRVYERLTHMRAIDFAAIQARELQLSAHKPQTLWENIYSSKDNLTIDGGVQ